MSEYADNKVRFVEKLQSTQEKLQTEGVDFRIVGSLAAASYLNIPLNFERKGAFATYQRIPDIDIITARNHVDTTRRLHSEMLASDFPVFLGIIPAIAEIDLRPNEEYSYLRHKALAIPVKTKVFEPHIIPFEDTTIVSVSPPTLKGLYGNGAWLNRPKDKNIIDKLSALGTTFDHNAEDYLAFETYVQQRRALYPGFLMGKFVLEKTLNLLPGKIEGFIRHYGAKSFINGRASSILAYKPI